jgi:hypothetical protein
MKVFYSTLILLALNSILASGQTECDNATNEIFIIAEEMPICKISSKHLDSIINDSGSPEEYGLKNGDTLNLSFIINCKGETSDYTLHNTEDMLLEEFLTNIFKENIPWEPAYQRGKPVGFRTTVKILIRKRSFKIDVENTKLNLMSKGKLNAT